MIRDTLSDWCQTPAALAVERTSPSDDQIPPPPSESELIDLTVKNLSAITPTWLDFSNRIRAGPANTLLPPSSTPGGLSSQYFSAGYFNLEPDDALVVTLDPADARYLGFQLGSDFFASFDYENHTSSLNIGQVEPNADGTITYVVSFQIVLARSRFGRLASPSADQHQSRPCSHSRPKLRYARRPA